MAVYKDGDKWRVIYRYTNYNGVYPCNQILSARAVCNSIGEHR